MECLTVVLNIREKKSSLTMLFVKKKVGSRINDNDLKLRDGYYIFFTRINSCKSNICRSNIWTPVE